MTLVVTFADGMLSCFTQNADGTMRQRALIDTGATAHAPVELAVMGTGLAQQYGWQLNGSPSAQVRALPGKRAPRAERAALPSGARRKRKLNNKYPPGAQKVVMIVDYIRTHGAHSMTDVLQGIDQPTDKHSLSNWYHTFTDLVRDGTLVKLKVDREGPRGVGQPRLQTVYSLAP